MRNTGKNFEKDSSPADSGRIKSGAAPKDPTEDRSESTVAATYMKNVKATTTIPAVICDFDDTVTFQNIASLLLDAFCLDPNWRELQKASREQRLSLKEYQESAFRSTKASRQVMQLKVKESADIRPYFRNLWEYCVLRSYPMAIVTVGLDFYVDAVLERESLKDIPRFAVETEFRDGNIYFNYPYSWDGSGASSQEICQRWGTCKCSVVTKYQRAGYSVLYVGDGRSDFCAASIADSVFARSNLAVECDKNGVKYSEFQDFGDVILELTKLEISEGSINDR